MNAAGRDASAVSVLVVEDVDEMRIMLEQLISGIPGLKVSGTARNLWEARLELERRRPGVLLLDEVLPGESIVEFLAEVADLGIPCLLMTGVENATHGLPPGAIARVSKPSWEDKRADLEAASQSLGVALLKAAASSA